MSQSAWVRHQVQRVRQAMIADWQGSRVLFFGALVVLVVCCTLTIYYWNHPAVDTSSDTINYVNVVNNRILIGGGLVDPLRTPGYPLLITLVFLLAGRGNLFAVSIVQAGLFALATLEVYLLGVLLWRRAWVAFAVGVLMATNTLLLAYAKALVVESLALWLVTTLALAVVLFLRRMQVRWLWCVALLTLATLMTRPEWAYVSVPLFAYLLLVAWRRGKLRRILPHALLAVLLLNGLLGAYILVNAAQNGLPAITFVQRINLLGKVMQYHMQNEAAPEYAQVAREINAYMAQGYLNPDTDLFVQMYPDLVANHWQLAGDYAASVVLRHPVEFALKSFPAMLDSFRGFGGYSAIHPDGPFAWLLGRLDRFSWYINVSYRFFPLVALILVGLLFWRRTRKQLQVEALGAVVLLAVYELILTTLGGYVEYSRLHIPFDPLMLLILWGSVLTGLVFLWPRAKVPVIRGLVFLWQRKWLVWGLGLLLIVLLNIAGAAIRHGLGSAMDVSAWPGLHLLEVHPSWAAAFVLLVVGAMAAAWQAYRTQTLRFVLKGQEVSTPTDAQADIAPELLVVKEPSPDRGGASGS
jgi:hypothetical protein